ncbi:hypothetical protein ACEZDB_36515 [Streptacidiphilus sp. N1-3]|uniref:Uncharacterized protein n=1 Tax=Streptacidiphilus alkalitolerans TaxID=3342712 RepID=A0ABV6XCX9_9ACTN
MDIAHRARKRTAQVGRVFLTVLAIAVQAAFFSGMPSYWRLQRTARSGGTRRARSAAEESLRARMGRITDALPFTLSFEHMEDRCVRGSRIHLGLTPNREYALIGRIWITAYFGTDLSIPEALDAICEHVPESRDAIHRYTDNPGRLRISPISVAHGSDIQEHLDWDTPGTYQVASEYPPPGSMTVRLRKSRNPGSMTLQQARHDFGTVISWTVSSVYLRLSAKSGR